MEKAKGPAGIGQYNPVVLSGEGRGDGGRRVWQKNELLLRMLNVRISVVENKVAKKKHLRMSSEESIRKGGNGTHPSPSLYWQFPRLAEEIHRVR